MRLEQYLNERFLNTVRIKSGFNAGDYDVFVNPSKKERQEVLSVGGGYRYIIDFLKKKVYVFTTETYHQMIMDDVPDLPSFNSFWQNGQHHDRIFTGDWSGRHNSDALFAPIYTNEEMRDFLEQDWKWVSRYIDDLAGLIKMIKYEATG